MAKNQAFIKELREERKPIIQQCRILEYKLKDNNNKEKTITSGPCKRIDGEKCNACYDPAIRWKLGNCHLATHILHADEQKRKINPLKASKKKSRR